MSAVLDKPLPLPVGESPGLWTLAWRRLMQDKVGVAAMVIVVLFLLLMLATASGLVAKNWNKELGVSFANPSFVADTQNFEAGANRRAAEQAREKAPPVDLSDIDPLAKWYPEWEQRTRQYQNTEVQRLEMLPFGGDQWGRDVLQKVLKGAEASIFVGFAAAIFAVLLGTVFGALAGYFGRWVNDLFEWIYNVFTSVPYILLVLACAAVAASSPLIPRGLFTVVLILAITGWTGIYRLIRAEYIKHRAREYVRAADAIGASDRRRMFVHILPNVSHVVLVQLSQHVVQFIKAEVILSFLGFGVPVEMVSWGTMLAEAQIELIIGKWWQLTAVGVSMALLVTAFSLFTDALRDALDPKLK